MLHGRASPLFYPSCLICPLSAITFRSNCRLAGAAALSCAYTAKHPQVEIDQAKGLCLMDSTPKRPDPSDPLPTTQLG
jgi:hypothetical protein